MATSRYQNRETAINADDLYKNLLKKRGLHFFEQYRTARLAYPSEEEISRMTLVPHLWVMGNRFYKLANTYYSDPSYWWVIAWFNKLPTEHLVSVGQIIHIPTNLEEILDYLDI